MWQVVRTPIITVLAILIGIYAFTHFLGPIPFSVTSITTTKTNLFTVQGTGETTAIPDTAQLMLGINKTAPSVTTAQSQVNAIINKITEDLKKLGIEDKDIKTTNYSVSPNYDYTNGTQRLNGYVVNADIEVKIKPLEKANQAIDIATQDGATNVGNVQFVLDDAKQKELEEQARKEAIDTAKEKAQSISRISGIRLGKLVDVQENKDVPPMPYDLKAADSAPAEGRSSTQLEPGENKITANVTLSYETY